MPDDFTESLRQQLVESAKSRARVRALAQQWINDEPANVTESAVKVILADAGRRVLEALDGPDA